MFYFKIYGYCLMDTHGHVIIDGGGADISKVMHSINQSYSQYFNRKYKRHGHVFQDRFKSKIVYDDRYLITLSAYDHNNPSIIRKYEDKVEDYSYSSYGIYLGINKDKHGIVDYNFILNQFAENMKEARKQYFNFVSSCRGKEIDEDVEFRHEKSQYRSERALLVRNYSPDKVINYAASCLNKKTGDINIKYIKDNKDFKALCAFLMNNLCNMKQKDICKVIGSITQSHASKLCNAGYRLVCDKEEYALILKNLINTKIL